MNFIFISIFIGLKLFFHLEYCISKRRTYKHDPDSKILPDIQCISNILVVYCLFSLLYVSQFFLEEKKSEHIGRGNEKPIFANNTYSMCENINFHNTQKKSEENIITYSGGCKKSWLVVFSIDKSLLFISLNSFKIFSKK